MRSILCLMVVFALGLAVAAPARADMSTSAEHAVLMDAATGQVLWEKQGFVPMPPASMSKLMTVELLFQRLKDGRVKLTDRFPVSERAWRERGGSTMFVNIGDTIEVDNLIRGIIIQSGNDACIVVAEALGGSVEGFVDMMNKRAKQLGLTASHFVNPNGLDQPPGQRMSAYDLAKLARHLIRDYPKYYHFFGERSFTWQNISQPNRNLVLSAFPGADGLKTGHLDSAGYGVTTSAVRNGQRFILVLNGLRYPDLDKEAPPRRDWFAERRRADEAARLLGLAFREFRQYRLFAANAVAGSAKVFQGAEDSVPLKVAAPVTLTMEVDSRAGLKMAVRYSGPVHATIVAGQQIGTLRITAPDFPPYETPLYAAKAVDRAGFFSRVFSGLSRMIFGNKDTQ